MEKKEHSISLADYIIPAIAALFNVLIILFPEQVLEGARDGLFLWFNNVAPSLLPFIIGTNILSALGVVAFLGVWLEPFTQAVFRVPGSGGYAVVTGMMCGYPLGARVVAGQRETGEITREQAQRLISFCNNCGPLFMLGALGAGLFGNPRAGLFILLCHYGSALIMGLMLGMTSCGGAAGRTKKNERGYTARLPRKALRAMRDARNKNRRSFAEILSDSVRAAMEAITMVGGFIILFSVVTRILTVTGIFELVFLFAEPLFEAVGAPPALFAGAAAGFFEMTNGCGLLSGEGFSMAQMVIATAVVSFGGLCVFAQTVAFVHKTDISPFKCFLAKLFHAGLSAVVARIAFPFFNFRAQTGTVAAAFVSGHSLALDTLIGSGALFVLTTAGIFAAAIILGVAALVLPGVRRAR